ncbi:hypothetical protein RAS14_00620 [Achromobacter aegrifaciens]|nr:MULTISPECIES: hypothetical protein [Achromobacter]MDQ1758233.1 hypothetical protein [Achromobacter aegrifaciens]
MSMKNLAALLAAAALLTACGQSEQDARALADKKATSGQFKPSEEKAY